MDCRGSPRRHESRLGNQVHPPLLHSSQHLEYAQTAAPIRSQFHWVAFLDRDRSSLDGVEVNGASPATDPVGEAGTVVVPRGQHPVAGTVELCGVSEAFLAEILKLQPEEVRECLPVGDFSLAVVIHVTVCVQVSGNQALIDRGFPGSSKLMNAPLGTRDLAECGENGEGTAVVVEGGGE